MLRRTLLCLALAAGCAGPEPEPTPTTTTTVATTLPPPPAPPAPAPVAPAPPAVDDAAEGERLMKTGFYLKASEHQRMALLDDPASAEKKLAFAESLFAIGNYSYAGYSLRRAVAQLPADRAFARDLVGRFPSPAEWAKAVADLERYVEFSPNDPAGLTVLAYVRFTAGDDARCRAAVDRLTGLDARDPFAGFFQAQLELRR